MVVGHCGLGEPVNIWPQVGAQKRGPGKRFRIVFGKIEGKIERLFVIDIAAGEYLLPLGHVATVVGRVADVALHLLRDRPVEEIFGNRHERVEQCFVDAVADDVHEAHLTGGGSDLLSDNVA